MKKLKSFIKTKTDYDVENIISITKKKFTKNLIQAVLFSLLSVLSAVPIIIYGSHLPAFIVSALLLIVSVLITVKKLRDIRFSDLKNICGQIVNVSVDNVTHRLFASYGMWIRRKYDTYKTDSPRITLYIKDDKEILFCQFIANKKYLNYYDTADQVIHIWGARYLVKTISSDKTWLCPICGNFNTKDVKTCTSCGNKVLK